MMIAATICYEIGNQVRTESKVYTSDDFASVDDVLNHLRFEYFQKYKSVHATLLIELETVEYSLDLFSGIIRVKKAKALPTNEHSYLAHLFDVYAFHGGFELDRWMTQQCWYYETEDDLIKSFNERPF